MNLNRFVCASAYNRLLCIVALPPPSSFLTRPSDIGCVYFLAQAPSCMSVCYTVLATFKNIICMRQAQSVQQAALLFVWHCYRGCGGEGWCPKATEFDSPVKAVLLTDCQGSCNCKLPCACLRHVIPFNARCVRWCFWEEFTFNQLQIIWHMPKSLWTLNLPCKTDVHHDITAAQGVLTQSAILYCHGCL